MPRGVLLRLRQRHRPTQLLPLTLLLPCWTPRGAEGAAGGALGSAASPMPAPPAGTSSVAVPGGGAEGVPV